MLTVQTVCFIKYLFSFREPGILDLLGIGVLM